VANNYQLAQQMIFHFATWMHTMRNLGKFKTPSFAGQIKLPGR
jgi:hypothetical protein